MHVTFAREGRVGYLCASHGFLKRTDQQFHWQNEATTRFDDFLADLNSRHRKAIRRERRDAVANGITIEPSPAATSPRTRWMRSSHFYMETGSRKWGTALPHPRVLFADRRAHGGRRGC